MGTQVGFSHFLENAPYILLDGAMGTQLDEFGLMSRACNNLEHPEAVLEIHRRYARSGCHAITANTLTMNRIYIETHGLEVSVRDVNRAGAHLAREAAGDRLYVLGNLSSTGCLLEPCGPWKEPQFRDAFREQAVILADSRVDAFIIETMFDLREAVCALRACREISPLPVIVSIAFATEEKGGRTIMGDSAEKCAVNLADAGADAIGANCGDLDPTQMAAVISILRSASDLPLLAQPNAGRPRLVGERTVFDMNPRDFAAGLAQSRDAGARLLGGCCGSTPEHIRAVAQLLESG